MTYSQTIRALAVPTRRSILEALQTQPMSVQQLTEILPISQAAVSQHLKRLRAAGLVEMESEGARHVYRLRLEGLAGLRAYLESFWGEVLDAFAEADGDADSTEGEKP
jgi:DNA-binding transcriptional ArsR family regulator